MITNLIYFQAFVIGTCIGSFLNVIIYRFPNDLSIIKPSLKVGYVPQVLNVDRSLPLTAERFLSLVTNRNDRGALKAKQILGSEDYFS